MTLMEDFTWAFRKVLYDWRTRLPKQVRNSLPPSHTASTLRFIRISACRKAVPRTIECRKWSQTNPWPINPNIPSYPLGMDEHKGPFLLTADYVCDGCKHPCVTNGDLISKLGLAEKKMDFSSRTLQRYMNAQDQMPVDQFRRVVANALANGWLGLWQAVSITTQTDQLVATRNGLLAVFRRASERKTFIEHQKFDVSEEEIEQELAKQLRLMERESTRVIEQRLKDENLNPEFRQMMEEVRFGDKRQ